MIYVVLLLTVSFISLFAFSVSSSSQKGKIVNHTFANKTLTQGEIDEIVKQILAFKLKRSSITPIVKISNPQKIRQSKLKKPFKSVFAMVTNFIKLT